MILSFSFALGIFYLLFSFLFILFSLFYSLVKSSIILSSRSLTYSASVTLLSISPSLFFISLIVLLFSSSRSLLNISYIFLMCAFILYLRSLIIFTIILFPCRLHISTSLICSSGVLSFSLYGTYFSTVLPYLTFCGCSFCSTGCRFIVLVDTLGEGVCLRGLCRLSGEKNYFLSIGGWG